MSDNFEFIKSCKLLLGVILQAIDSSKVIQSNEHQRQNGNDCQRRLLQRKRCGVSANIHLIREFFLSLYLCLFVKIESFFRVELQSRL